MWLKLNKTREAQLEKDRLNLTNNSYDDETNNNNEIRDS